MYNMFFVIGILDHISVSGSLLTPGLAGHHQFVDKINDGAGRLVWIKFCEHVALVSGLRRAASRDNGK